MMDPLRKLSKVNVALQTGAASAERVFSILDTPPTIVDKADAVKIDSFKEKIRFKNVSFRYESDDKVLKDISFEIPSIQTFTMLEKEISKYNLNFDIKSKVLKENIIEVNTILSLIPNQEVKHKILTELNLTTLISVDAKNFKDKKELEKIILIKLPTEIYPTLYETFVYLFSQAGVKNITIKKEVDFEKLYNEKTKS